MEISTAHIFYVVMILSVGLLAGFFLGRRSLEADLKRAKRRQQRRQALAKRAGQAREDAQPAER